MLNAFGDVWLESTKVNERERKEQPEQDATAAVYI